MLILCLAGGCSLVISLVLTRFFRDFFAFLEMVDQPGNPRKVHLRPIPRVGGIPIAISYLLALLPVLLLSSLWHQIMTGSSRSLNLLWHLLPALLIVFITGLLDDFMGLTPAKKLAGQLLAGSLAFLAGVRFAPPGAEWQTILWDAPATLLWLAFCANAFNLIDGLDGLASGVALVGGTGLLTAAIIHHQPVLALGVVPLLGALLGFLYYNFNPASVFLGDSGSLLIGFLLGCFGLIWSRHARHSVGVLAPLMMIAVPAADVGISILRRFLRHQPIFHADRNHIHHRLLSLGMTHRDAALTLWGASAVGVALALLQTVVHPLTTAVPIVICGLAAYMGVRQLRYVEFRAVARLLGGGELRRILRMRICLNEFEESLAAARSQDQCWQATLVVCQAAGFRHVALDDGENRFESPLSSDSPERSVRTVIPLGLHGTIAFVHDARMPTQAMWMAPIVGPLSVRLSEIQRPERPAGAPLEELKPMAAAAH